MKYALLFALEILHSYYVDQHCLDFQIVPSIKTRHMIENHRCILKTNQHGISVSMAVDSNDSPLIPLEPYSPFVFHLYPRNSEFGLITDLTEFANISAPLYTNLNSDSSTFPIALALTSRILNSTESFLVQNPSQVETFVLGGKPITGVTPNDFHIAGLTGVSHASGFNPRSKSIGINTQSSSLGASFSVTFPSPYPLERGAMADVEIWPNGTLSGSSVDPAIFQIRLNAKEAYWRYYVITENATSDFQVVDTGNNPILFGNENRLEVNGGFDEQDFMAYRLMEQFPEHRLIRFTSDSPIAIRQKVNRTVQLQREREVLIHRLPNPSPKQFMQQLTIDNGKPLQESVLYSVLKLITS